MYILTSFLNVINFTNRGIEWYLENVGLGKVWPDLEISEAFLMGLEVSFLHNFFLPKGFGVSDLSFFSFLLLFRSHIFQSSWVQLIELS